jgi:hypothetical protein
MKSRPKGWLRRTRRPQSALSNQQEKSPVVDRQCRIAWVLVLWQVLQMTSFWHKTVCPFSTKVIAESEMAARRSADDRFSRPFAPCLASAEDGQPVYLLRLSLTAVIL